MQIAVILALAGAVVAQFDTSIIDPIVGIDEIGTDASADMVEDLDAEITTDLPIDDADDMGTTNAPVDVDDVVATEEFSTGDDAASENLPIE